jgi:hypothetical protein
MRIRPLISRALRFARREDGVALVEFALFLPVFLLAFFVIVEFGRTFFNYQSAVAGVRDATRFAAPTLDQHICVGAPNGGGGILTIAEPASPDRLFTIVERNLLNETGVLPVNVRLLQVSSSYRCVVEPGNYRQVEVPVARVEARLEVILPLGEILVLNGQPMLENITTDVVDESRVFGL